MTVPLQSCTGQVKRGNPIRTPPLPAENQQRISRALRQALARLKPRLRNNNCHEVDSTAWYAVQAQYKKPASGHGGRVGRTRRRRRAARPMAFGRRGDSVADQWGQH